MLAAFLRELTSSEVVSSVAGGLGSALVVFFLALYLQWRAQAKEAPPVPVSSPRGRKVGLLLLLVGIVLSALFIPFGIELAQSVDQYGNPSTAEGAFMIVLGLSPVVVGAVVVAKNLNVPA
ncbi:MAG: hypothetical protein Kow0069_18050 [Promethearchaeota archaeon]